MNPWLILFNVCIIAFTAYAMVSDVRSWRLPNWLSLTGLAGAIVFHSLVGWISNGAAGLLDHLLFAAGGFGVSFGILFVAWLVGAGSAGDAKLMGAVGAWVGPVAILAVLVLSGVIEILRLVVVFLARSMKRGMRRAMEDMKHHGEMQKSGKPRSVWAMKSPYGVSAVIATWLVVITFSILATKQTKYWQPAEPRQASQLAIGVEQTP
jgi:prepilin peptidase CpaA